MKISKIFKILILCIALISLIIAIAPEKEIKLIKGKNNLTTPENFKPIYVKEFVNQHTEIQTITLREDNKAQAYINYLNGIGKNFILQPNKTYEITCSKNISIIT